jgi:hypothetical protein
MSLREQVKKLQVTLPFMEGKEKGDFKRLLNTKVTIREYGFLTDDKDKPYVVFVVDEDPQNFYFGGMVLTDNLMTLDATEGCREQINTEGLPVLFGQRLGKNKREYTTVTYYPQD